MSHLKLYKHDWTPPSRAVMMVAEALGLHDIALIDVDLDKGENMSPEFLKKNPLHALPLLEDGEFVVSDSHAISAYIATAYGKDDSLCPKDPKKRAILDQRLHFDNGILYIRLRAITMQLIWRDNKKRSEIEERYYDDLRQAYCLLRTYGYLETFLNESEWLAGDHMTIADLCTVATLSCCDMVEPFDRKKYPKTSAWWDKLAALPYYKTKCEPGQRAYTEFFNEFMKNK